MNFLQIKLKTTSITKHENTRNNKVDNKRNYPALE